jgi:hypothetical protein
MPPENCVIFMLTYPTAFAWHIVRTKQAAIEEMVEPQFLYILDSLLIKLWFDLLIFHEF